MAQSHYQSGKQYCKSHKTEEKSKKAKLKAINLEKLIAEAKTKLENFDVNVKVISVKQKLSKQKEKTKTAKISIKELLTQVSFHFN